MKKIKYYYNTNTLRYEKLESNLPGRNYDSASIFAGIKVQR